MDFWRREPMKKWQRGVSWSREEVGSGRELRRAQGWWHPQALCSPLETANGEATASAPQTTLTAVTKYARREAGS